MPLAFLGGMILWLGWFGFNPGSTMGVVADGGLAASHIVVTTNLACAAGLLLATLTSYFLTRRPDFSMTVNGALAGLVAITAPCAFVTPLSAVVIGAVGGFLVVVAVRFFDWIRVDDPVGALSVHLVCGIWGTLSVGLFASTAAPGGIDADGLFYGGGLTLISSQVTGILAVAAFVFSSSYILWSLLKLSLGIRVTPSEEALGLDISEMGMEAYPHERAIDVNEMLRVSRLGRFEDEIISKDLQDGTSSPLAVSSFPVYRLMLANVSEDELLDSWSESCADPDAASKEFKTVYEAFTTLSGTTMHFRGGEKQKIIESLRAYAKEISENADVVTLNAESRQ